MTRYKVERGNVHNDSEKDIGKWYFWVKQQPHKKVRFGVNADKHLRALPSHQGEATPVRARVYGKRKERLKKLGAFAGLFIFALFVSLGLFAASGNMLPVLRDQAEKALLRAVPSTMRAQLGQTDVSFLWPPQIGITYRDVQLSSENGESLTTIGTLTLGVEPFSLLDGEPSFNSLAVYELSFSLPSNERGELPGLKIGTAHDAFDQFSAQISAVAGRYLYQPGGMNIDLGNVNFVLPENGYSEKITIAEMDIAAANGLADFKGQIVVDGYEVPLGGQMFVPQSDAADDNFSLTVSATAMPMPWRRLQTIVSNELSDHVPEARPAPLLADVELTARNAVGIGDDELAMSVTPIDMAFKLDAGDFVPVRGRFGVAMDFAGQAITIKQDQWNLGRSEFLLNGRIRDSVLSDEKNVYDFEMLANRGRISASDAPSSPVRFAARAKGMISLDKGVIEYSRLEIDSDSGTAIGQGDLTLKGDFPTAVFEVVINDMSISGVKQFWPAPVARAARRWVLTNLAGGRLVSGRFDIAEPLRRRIPGTDRYLTGSTEVALSVAGVRFDVAGEIPPVRDADGSVSFVDGVTRVTLDRGTVFLPTGRTAQASDGLLTIFPADETDGVIRASLDLGVSGQADAVGELISFDPINAGQFYAFDPDDLTGRVDGRVNLDFVLNGGEAGPQPDWSVDFNVADAGSAAKIEGRLLDGLDGRIQVDPRRAAFTLKGDIDDLPADIAMVIPFGNSGVAPKREIALTLGDKERRQLAPGLETILTGTTPVDVAGAGDTTTISADLTSAKLDLPWIGWSKGSGIRAGANFSLLQNGSLTSLRNFKLTGNSFGLNNGRIDVDNEGLKTARFGFAQLNKDDNFSVDLNRQGAGYAININGKSMDGRAMMRHVRAQARQTSSNGDFVPVDVSADIGRLQGFHGEHLNNVKIELRVRGGSVTRFRLAGSTKEGFPVFLSLDGAGSGRSIKLEALGAGAFLRFADIYTNVRGGTLNVSLNGSGVSTLSGKADLFDFRVFNEPKLAQLVSSNSGNSQSLEQAVNRRIDTREVKFERATSDLVFGPGRLDIARAVARGPLAGFTIQGKVFDSNNQTRLTGTFLPAYGLNSLFAEIPILGVLLGNGRDRGLIGVTFKLDGSFDSPNVTVNPLSVIAPGVFRSIFEFR